MSQQQNVTESELHAYMDGELDRRRLAAVEAYLAANPETAERLAAYRRTDDSLRAQFDPVLEEPLPTRLERRSRTFRLARTAAAIAWFTLGATVGWTWHRGTPAEQQPENNRWAQRAAVAHAIYSPEVRHPVEVGADQEAHLVAWLSKRLGTPLKIPKLNALGYSLVGGRLLPGERAPVAQFMYQDPHGQRLTLYVRTNREQSKETAFRFAQDGSVRVFYWVDRGLGFALSGEIGKEDLLKVATAVYQQLNP
jgi:anti-sigma factor RsiW